jgi:predicted outer membrane repeat protein
VATIAAAVLGAGGLAALAPSTAGATPAGDEASFVGAWESSAETQIDLTANVTITCSSGLPSRDSSTPITVDGHGFTLTQTCAGDGVLDQAGTGAVTLNDITITGGDDTAGTDGGGALHTFGDVTVNGSTLTGNHTDNEGGAIETENEATATLNQSTVAGNSAGGSGGGIAAQGLTTVTQSTISNNTSGNNGGAMRAYGGASVVNSTIVGNSSAGGGASIDTNGDVTLVYATIVGNTGGANVYAGNLVASASVIAEGTVSSQCVLGGSTTSNGYNVDDDGTCGFGGGPGDLSDYAGSLGLGPLEPHQSVRDTMYPQTGSPLLDAVPVAACGMGIGITVDEDGVTRPQGTGCEIGASEVFLGGTDNVPTVPVPIAAQPAFTG